MFNPNALAFEPAFKQAQVQEELEEVLLNQEQLEEELELLLYETELQEELQEDEDEELRKELALFEGKSTVIFTEWTQKDFDDWKASQASQAS
jgi:thymidylate kinase